MRDDLVTAIRESIGSASTFRLVVLFGSFAKGTDHARSDVDIAVLPEDPDLDGSDELTLQADLERALGRTVDLIRLDRASLPVRWRILRDGIMVHQSPDVATKRFIAQTAIEHDEMANQFARASERYRAYLARTHEDVL